MPFSLFLHKTRNIILFIFRTIIDYLVARKEVRSIPHTVLVVRLDAIGDFILWIDAAKELRKLYPQRIYKITLLGNMAWAPLAEKLPYFDEVWSLNRIKFCKDMVYRYELLNKIKKSGFEVAIHPVYSRDYHWGDAVIRASGAQQRIGFDGDCTNIKPWLKRISDRWYTDLMKVDNSATMELIRNAQFMRAIGLEEFKARIPVLDIDLRAPEGFNLTNYYVLFPSAGWHGRKWPVQNFIELAKQIYRTTGWTGVVCGGVEDAAICNEVLKDCDIPIANWIGKTTLLELAGIISEARLVIGNETSAVHISAALSIPCVCIMGGGHYGRFLPYVTEEKAEKIYPIPVIYRSNCFGCSWHCIFNVSNGYAVSCIKNISVDDVWDSIHDILDAQGKSADIK